MTKWEPNGGKEVEKHPYVEKLKVTNDMSDGQKEFLRLFNSMQDFLVKIGRMQDK